MLIMMMITNDCTTESEASPLPVYCTSTEGFTLAHRSVGYLTSDYTSSTDIGAERCPWKIVAKVRAFMRSKFHVTHS